MGTATIPKVTAYMIKEAINYLSAVNLDQIRSCIDIIRSE